MQAGAKGVTVVDDHRARGEALSLPTVGLGQGGHHEDQRFLDRLRADNQRRRGSASRSRAVARRRTSSPARSVFGLIFGVSAARGTSLACGRPVDITLGHDRNESTWAARISVWRASGQTAPAFSKGKGFSPRSLHSWASRLGKAAPGEPQPRVRLARVVSAVRASAVPAETAIVIEFGNTRLSVRRGFDSATLRAVLGRPQDGYTAAPRPAVPSPRSPSWYARRFACSPHTVLLVPETGDGAVACGAADLNR